MEDFFFFFPEQYTCHISTLGLLLSSAVSPCSLSVLAEGVNGVEFVCVVVGRGHACVRANVRAFVRIEWFRGT